MSKDRRSKYNNSKFTDENGIKWDGRKEYNRFLQLKQQEERGEIKDLQRQVKFILIPKMTEIETITTKTGKVKTKEKTIQREVDYVADFLYQKDGVDIVEDVKSPATAKDKVFQLKKKMFRYKFGQEISVFI